MVEIIQKQLVSGRCIVSPSLHHQNIVLWNSRLQSVDSSPRKVVHLVTGKSHVTLSSNKVRTLKCFLLIVMALLEELVHLQGIVNYLTLPTPYPIHEGMVLHQ